MAEKQNHRRPEEFPLQEKSDPDFPRKNRLLRNSSGTAENPKTLQNTFAWLVFTALIICVGLLMLSSFFYLKSNQTQIRCEQEIETESVKTNISTAEGWGKAAHMLAQSMDMSVDPCEDFYEFACGNWKRANLPPKTTVNRLQRQINEQIANKVFTNDTITNNWDQDGASAKAKILYDSCLNVENAASIGKQIKDDFIEKYGSWPDVTRRRGPWTNSLGSQMGKLAADFGLSTFISFYVVSNSTNSSSGYTLQIGPASLTYPLKIYKNKEAWPEYRKDLIQRVTMLAKFITGKKDERSEYKIKLQAELIANLEEEIAMLIDENDENWTQYLHMSTMRAITDNRQWNNIQMSKYFDELIPYNRNPSQKIQLYFPEYLNKLNEWLAVEKSEKYTKGKLLQAYFMYRLANFIVEVLPWKTVKVSRNKPADISPSYLQIKHTSWPYQDAYFTEGAFNFSSSKTDCIRLLQLNRPDVVGALYLKHVVGLDIANQKSRRIDTMLNNVIKEVSGMIDQVNWMTDESKTAAQAKLNNMQKNTVYFTSLLDERNMDHLYSNFQPEKRDKFLTLLSDMIKFRTKNTLMLVQDSLPDKTDMIHSIALVNAWYMPRSNSVNIPAGILIPPFFQMEFPESINYGAIGSIIGHEVLHAFETSGVQWDSSGSLNPLLDEESLKGFHTMNKCLIDQYDQSFCSGTYCLNGTQTLAENIADNAGIKAAWRAYQKHKSAEDVRLPSYLSTFTQDQLFFISFGNVRCANPSVEILNKHILLAPHSPAKQRVDLTLSNFPDFGKAFKCPSKSKMIPDKRCVVY